MERPEMKQVTNSEESSTLSSLWPVGSFQKLLGLPSALSGFAHLKYFCEIYRCWTLKFSQPKLRNQKARPCDKRYKPRRLSYQPWGSVVAFGLQATTRLETRRGTQGEEGGCGYTTCPIVPSLHQSTTWGLWSCIDVDVQTVTSVQTDGTVHTTGAVTTSHQAAWKSIKQVHDQRVLVMELTWQALWTRMNWTTSSTFRT